MATGGVGNGPMGSDDSDASLETSDAVEGIETWILDDAMCQPGSFYTGIVINAPGCRLSPVA